MGLGSMVTMLNNMWNRNSYPNSKLQRTILRWDALQWHWDTDWKLQWWTYVALSLFLKSFIKCCSISCKPESLPSSLRYIYLQMKEHGVTGMPGEHARHHVAREHELAWEILRVDSHVVATQQTHKFVQVRVNINLSYLIIRYNFIDFV